VERGSAFLVGADLALDDAAGQGGAPGAKRTTNDLELQGARARIGDEDGFHLGGRSLSELTTILGGRERPALPELMSDAIGLDPVMAKLIPSGCRCHQN